MLVVWAVWCGCFGCRFSDSAACLSLHSRRRSGETKLLSVLAALDFARHAVGARCNGTPLELRGTQCYCGGLGAPWETRPMSSGSAMEFEAFARDCVQLAAQANSPELREKLLSMARDWMRAAMEEDDAAPSTDRSLRRSRFQQPSRGAA